MKKEQADIVRQQLQQKPISYELVEINNTSSNQPSVIAIPPTISEDKDVTNFEFNGSPRQERQQKVEQIYDKLNPAVPTPEDSQKWTPPIPPPPSPPPPPPPLPSSQNDNIIQYPQDKMEKGSSQEDIIKPQVTEPVPEQVPESTERLSSKSERFLIIVMLFFT